MKTVGDELFVSEMKKVGLDLDPMMDEELQAMLVEIGNISPALLTQARKAAEVERAR
jgi:hypothetical protein